MNAYELLGVDTGASAIEIHKAYVSKVEFLRETANRNRRALHDLRMAHDLVLNASTREVGLHIQFVYE